MRLQSDMVLLEQEENINKLENGCRRSINTMRIGDDREHSLSFVAGLLPSPVFASDVEGSPSNMGNRFRSGSYSSLKSNLNSSSCVQVAVRVRPLLPFEMSKNLQSYQFNSTKSCIHVFGDKSDCDDYDEYCHEDDDGERTGGVHYQNIRVSMPTYPYAHLEEEEDAIDSSLPGAEFTFDYVFPNATSQSQFYSTCITPLVQSCLSGYNATVLAYGQTGSGKTFTILGPAPGLHANSNSNASTPLTSPLSETSEKSFDFDARSVGAVCQEDDFDFSKTDNQNVEVNLQGLPLSLQQGTIAAENMDTASSPTAMATSADDGVLPRALRDLFQSLHQLSHKSQSFTFQVKIQFLELYGENIRDLLAISSSSPKQNHNRNSNALFIRDGAPGNDSEVVGASEVKVGSANEALEYLRLGSKMRVTGKTAMNNESSRSHAIFTVIIYQTTTRNSSFVYLGGDTPNTSTSHKVSRNRSSPKYCDDDAMTVETKTSKFHFVDLAGSEKTKRTQTRGKRFKEGIEINKGLLALGNVISALGNPKKQQRDSTRSTSSKSKKMKQQKQHHVPYRDSKLTRILKGSLGGNHKTLMIACVSPSVQNRVESINTLRYADRAKNIQNKAKVNTHRSKSDVNHKLRELQNQVVALAAELLRLRYDDNADEYSCHDDNCDYDDNEEDEEENDSIVRNDKAGDCQFSLKFLESLVKKSDSCSRHRHDRPPLVRNKRRNTSYKKNISCNQQPASSVSKGQSTASSGNASQKVFTFQSIDSKEQIRNSVEGEADPDVDSDTTCEQVLTLNDTFQTDNRDCYRENRITACNGDIADASIYDGSVLEIKKSFATVGEGSFGRSNSITVPANVSAATNVVDYDHDNDSASFDLNSIVIPRYVDGEYDRLTLRSPGGESTKENHQHEEHYRESKLYHENQNRELVVDDGLEHMTDQSQEKYKSDELKKEHKNAMNERTTPIDLPFDEALHQISDESNVIDGCSNDGINTLTRTLHVPREHRHQEDHEQNSTLSISSRLTRRYNVRSINEIYNHLEGNRCREEEEKEKNRIHGLDFFHRAHADYQDNFDDESSTIKSYISGLHGQTLEREKLLQKIELNQERYQVLRLDHELKLHKVEEQITKYEHEKRNLISLLALVDESSYFSTGPSCFKERDMLDLDSDILSYEQFSEQTGIPVSQTKLGAVQQPSVLNPSSISTQQRWKDFEAQLSLYRDYVQPGGISTQSVADLQTELENPIKEKEDIDKQKQRAEGVVQPIISSKELEFNKSQKKLEENVFISRVPSVLNLKTKSIISNKSGIGINSFESFYLKKDRKKTYQGHTAAITNTKDSSETKTNLSGTSPSNLKNRRHIINSSEFEEFDSETQEEQDLRENLQEEDNGDNCFGSMFINCIRNLFLQKNEGGGPLLLADHMRGY